MSNEIEEIKERIERKGEDLYNLGLKLGRIARRQTTNYKSWLKRYGLLNAFNKVDAFHDGFLDGWKGW
jgi:hypothetical protein